MTGQPFNKFNPACLSFAEGAMNLSADTLKLMLLSPGAGAPSVNAAVYGDVAAQELGFGNGYVTGGFQVTRESSGQTDGLYTLVLANLTFTATGPVGPFRWLVLYSTNTGVLGQPLIGWWDYGSPVTLSEAQPFTVDFDQTFGTVTLQ
jgi:hypothetical protein